MSGETGNDTPYWQQNGWERDLPREGIEIYKGSFHVQKSPNESADFKGFVAIIITPSISTDAVNIGETREAAVWIENPPEEIWGHRHHTCLALTQTADESHGARFTLHFVTPPRDADSAILYMENMLTESFNPDMRLQP